MSNANLLKRAQDLRKQADELERLSNRPLPIKWKVGHKVRYIRDSEWAWKKGDIARITRFLDGPKPTADQYQVFYTSSGKGFGTFWTTPDDVEWIEE